MDTKPNVITISYGRHLFDTNNVEFKRHRLIAQSLGKLDMVVFTLRHERFERTEGDSNFVIHPTNSRHKLLMPFDACKVAANIIRTSTSKPIVTTQDPATAGLVGWLLKKRYHVQLVVQEHCDILSTPFWKKESTKNLIEYYVSIFVVRRADIIRTVAKRIEAAMRHVGATAPVTQLPVALDAAPFLAADTARPHERATFEYVSVTRFVKQKNLPLLIQAFAAAYRADSRLRLTLVGKGSEEMVVRAEIAKQFPPAITPEPPIIIKPWTDDVPSLFKNADAYVLSSNYEGWGRVLIEAAAAGLPIVTTDVGCVGEVVFHKQHALVVPLNNQPALTSALLQLAHDDALYQKLVAGERALVAAGLPGTDIEHYGVAWRNTLSVVAHTE